MIGINETIYKTESAYGAEKLCEPSGAGRALAVALGARRNGPLEASSGSPVPTANARIEGERGGR